VRLIFENPLRVGDFFWDEVKSQKSKIPSRNFQPYRLPGYLLQTRTSSKSLLPQSSPEPRFSGNAKKSKVSQSLCATLLSSESFALKEKFNLY
jgi:hypothetical protein